MITFTNFVILNMCVCVRIYRIFVVTNIGQMKKPLSSHSSILPLHFSSHSPCSHPLPYLITITLALIFNIK